MMIDSNVCSIHGFCIHNMMMIESIQSILKSIRFKLSHICVWQIENNEEQEGAQNATRISGGWSHMC